MSETYNICCIICSSLSSQNGRKASILAEKLDLPLQQHPNIEYRYHLVYTDNRLELQYNPHLHKYKHRSVYVDFLYNYEINKRLLTSTIKDPLARAVGIKSGKRPHIADATAGLGQDGFTLAWLGCKVVLIERSVIIHALLDDGLKRATENSRLEKIIKENITLLNGNSIDVLSNLTVAPDTVLLDPMYPSQKKRPLNKKEMRVLRDVVGNDTDSYELFKASLLTADSRVVVKRPKGAEEIVASPRPSHQISMKSGRFDVYLKNYL